MSEIIPQTYAALLTEIKDRIRTAQYAALKAVNKELIGFIGTSAKRLSNVRKAKLGANPLSSNYRKTCVRNFQNIKGSQREIFGECVIFTCLIVIMKN